MKNIKRCLSIYNIIFLFYIIFVVGYFMYDNTFHVLRERGAYHGMNLVSLPGKCFGNIFQVYSLSPAKRIGPVAKHAYLQNFGLPILSYNLLMVTTLSGSSFRTTRAGLPETTTLAGTSLRTAAPAPTTEFSPMVTPLQTIAEPPIQAPLFSIIGAVFPTGSVLS